MLWSPKGQNPENQNLTQQQSAANGGTLFLVFAIAKTPERASPVNQTQSMGTTPFLKPPTRLSRLTTIRVVRQDPPYYSARPITKNPQNPKA